MNSHLTKLIKRFIKRKTKPVKETLQDRTELQCAIRTCREKLEARNRFYASLPLGREKEIKLPKDQWVYFLKGRVGIKYIGETLTSSITHIRTREEVRLPKLLDSERQHKLRVIRGYVIDRRSGRRYTAGDSVNFQRGEPMQLTLKGHIWIAWTPPLPSTTPLFFHTNATSNSEHACEHAAVSLDSDRND